MNVEIHGGRALLPEGFVEDARITVRDGRIDAIDGARLAPGEPDGAGWSRVDATGCLVLPGIVDFHGDAFEKSIAPRDGSRFPSPVALRYVDAQLVACGITTGCYSPTLSWQSHRPLRNDEGASRIVEEFASLRTSLRADSLLHLRWEIHHLAGEALVAEWLERGRIDLLAFNDHLSWMRERLAQPKVRASMALSFGMSEDDLLRLADETETRKPLALAAVDRLAAVARERGIPMCSHDEESREQREWYHERGCLVSEFPVNEETARVARELGDDVVLGAPNVLKGGSLYGRLSGRDAIAKEQCTVLASDYYYPSLLHAPFLLEELRIAPLESAWPLVSANAARALGLHDRGTIEPGHRADLIVVARRADGTPEVIATIVGGRAVWLDEARLEAATTAISAGS